jgi:predicted RND superfamily exporter protein
VRSTTCKDSQEFRPVASRKLHERYFQSHGRIRGRRHSARRCTHRGGHRLLRMRSAALEPGEAATAAVRQAASDLKLARDLQAAVRLTGQVPIDDQEFAIVREHAFADIAATILTVLVVLWLALRSLRIVLAVVFALVVGLSTTAAFGLLTVGSFNLISIAFAVLFIGLGVDFGLQFSVRYRSERHDIDNLRLALSNAAKKAGIPLALAAAGTTAGFFSFLPTSFRGLSELGQIAGSGMLIAFVTTITVLPTALTILRPPSEPSSRRSTGS